MSLSRPSSVTKCQITVLLQPRVDSFQLPVHKTFYPRVFALEPSQFFYRFGESPPRWQVMAAMTSARVCWRIQMVSTDPGWTWMDPWKAQDRPRTFFLSSASSGQWKTNALSRWSGYGRSLWQSGYALLWMTLGWVWSQGAEASNLLRGCLPLMPHWLLLLSTICPVSSRIVG